MKQFFKYVFATVVGVIISFFVCVFLGFIIIAGIASSFKSSLSEMDGSSKMSIKPNSVLQMRLNYPINERSPDNPFENFDFANFEPEFRLGLNDILKNIEKAKEDNNIKGIYLDLSSIPAGFATINEIRNALLDFKSSGKFIITYGEVYTQGAYYLASVADNVYINPNGIFSFKGLSSTSVFLKKTLEKLELEPQIFKVGKFKSAVEPLIREDMSEPAKEQLRTFLGDFYDLFLNSISTSRGVSTAMLDSIAENILIRKPEDAVTYKLADATQYEDEVLDKLKEQVGIELEDDLELVKLSKYNRVPKSNPPVGIKDKIAVIYAEGNIVSGKSDEGQVGSETIVKAVREARENEKVKAIVLRVNSPGGSALASDVMWRELLLAKKDKPLVVSMGDLAASGGYYISCMADTIVAQPNTITGSIGVFGVLLNAKKFYNNKLGFTFDGVKTNKYADLDMGFLGTRPLKEDEKLIIQGEVDRIYDDFLQRVAEGRKSSKEDIHEIAQGRVWSGVRAKEIGLVDVLGGINEALAIAANMADLEEFKVDAYPKRKDPFEKIMLSFGASIKDRIIQSSLGEDYKLYQYTQKVKDMTGIQARMPFDLEIN